MKLTKRQQDFIGHLINENLKDVIKGRMIEATIDGDFVGRIDTSVIVSSMNDDSTMNDFVHSGVSQLVHDIMYKAFPRILEKNIKSHGISSSGVGPITKADVMNLYEDFPEYQDLAQEAIEKITSVVFETLIKDLTIESIHHLGVDSPDDVEV